MNEEYLKPDEQYELEKVISRNLETAIKEGNVFVAEGWLDMYNYHDRLYVCQNQTRYLNLKRRYENMIGRVK